MDYFDKEFDIDKKLSEAIKAFIDHVNFLDHDAFEEILDQNKDGDVARALEYAGLDISYLFEEYD